jgi:Cytochrome P450
VFALSFAGHETTTNLIGNALRHLLSRPESWPGRGRPRSVRFPRTRRSQRFPDMRLVPGQEVRYPRNISFRGPVSMQAEWTVAE